MKISLRTPPPQPAADASGAGTHSEHTSESQERNGFSDLLAGMATKSTAAKHGAVDPNAGGVPDATGQATLPDIASALASSNGAPSDLLSLLTSAMKTAAGHDGDKSTSTKADAAEAAQDGAASPAPSATASGQAGTLVVPFVTAPTSSTTSGTPPAGDSSSAVTPSSLLALQALAQSAKPKAGSTDRDPKQDVETPASISVSDIALTKQVAPPAHATIGKYADASGATPVPAASPATQEAAAPAATDNGKPSGSSDGTASARGVTLERSGSDIPGSQSVTPVAAGTIQPGHSPFTGSLAALDDASPAQDPGPGAGADGPSAASSVAPGPARTMTLQLAPSELGTVNVRMHVSGSTLDMKLSATDPQTVGLLNRDHDVLAGALRDQQYDLNSLVVQSMASDASSSGDQNAQPRSATKQDMASGQGQGSSDGGSRGRDQSSTSSGNQQRNRPSSSDGAYERRAGGLFV